MVGPKHWQHFIKTSPEDSNVSVSQFSCSVMSNSLQPHESQHVRPPCPSPTPGVHSDSCPSIPTLNQHLSSPRSLNQDRIKRSYIILLKSHRQRSSTIYYSLAMETIQGPINRWLDKEDGVFVVMEYLVQFSSVMSNSLQPHESQHARPPCLSPTPRVHSNSCPLSQWCHPAISSPSSPSPPAPNPSQHQGLFKWVSSSHHSES